MLQHRGLVVLTCHTAVEEQARALVKGGYAPAGATRKRRGRRPSDASDPRCRRRSLDGRDDRRAPGEVTVRLPFAGAVMAAIAAFACLAIALAFAGCSSPKSAPAPYDPRDLPPGPVGRSISYGYSLIVETHRLMRGYVRADLTCAECHLAAGMQPRGGSFVGDVRAVSAVEPARASRDRASGSDCGVLPLQHERQGARLRQQGDDRDRRYIAWLSRGTPDRRETRPRPTRTSCRCRAPRRALRAARRSTAQRCADVPSGRRRRLRASSIRRCGERARSTKGPAWRTSIG